MWSKVNEGREWCADEMINVTSCIHKSRRRCHDFGTNSRPGAAALQCGNIKRYFAPVQSIAHRFIVVVTGPGKTSQRHSFALALDLRATKPRIRDNRRKIQAAIKSKQNADLKDKAVSTA